MTVRLRAAFDDLANLAPVPGDLAAHAWAAGRRRRRTRRIGIGAVCVGLVATAVVIGPRLSDQSPPIASDGAGGVHSYPQRIGSASWSDRVPDTPGPIAAMVTDNNFGNAFTILVSSSGRTWGAPYVSGTLSPDGTRLLTLPQSAGSDTLTVRDLVTGELRTYGESGASDFRAVGHTGVTWSPDGASVLVSARSRGGKAGPMVLDLASGRATVLDGAWGVGFANATQVITLRRPGGRDHDLPPVLTTTDLRTGASSDLTLDLDEPWGAEESSSIDASISPDGRLLLLLEDPRDGQNATSLRFFSTEDGTELDSRSVEDWDAGCPTAWIGDDPVVPLKREGSPARSMLVTAEGARSIVAVHPRNQSFCVQWAADALAGGPHWALFGTSSQLWTWYWWQLGLVVAIPLLLLGGYRWRRRRTPRHRPTA
ncbi:hypothetical protein [Nocardioides sp.]|uniref:hypothetical protein n=1 Tax=Nocardioides sp. TaxID=35761 RepID=UPI003D112959